MTSSRSRRSVAQVGVGLVVPVLVPALALTSWFQLAGVSIGLGGLGWIALFLLGSSSWATVCLQLWPSANTIASYLPLGFGLCCLFSLSLIMLKLGTLISCTTASLVGLLIATLLAIAGCPGALPPTASPAWPAGVRLLSSQAAAALAATFLLANQLISSASLPDLSSTTILNAWADVILHANTVLSLSLLPPGTAPISTFDPAVSVIPYHYLAYALPAFLVSAIPQLTPLLSVLAVVAPFGLLLLLLPIMERLTAAATARHRLPGALSRMLCRLAVAVLAYCAWTRLIGNSFHDPLWLLITGPATLYACAMVVAGLQIAVGSPQQPLPGPVAAASLTLLVLLLSAFSKLQVAHSLALAGLTLLLLCAWRLVRPQRPLRRRHQVLLAGLTLAGAGLLLAANAVFHLARAHPLWEWFQFLQLTALQAWSSQSALTAVLSRVPAVDALLGVLTLAGPLFLLGLLWSVRGGAAARACGWLIPLIFASYLLGLLVSPAMPWDGSEFQNRSWPLLWSIGLWLLAAARFSALPPLPPRALLATALGLLALAAILTPAPKWTSAASSPIPRDWTGSYYPIRIRADQKRLARAMLPYRGRAFFFAPSIPAAGRSNLDDDPSLLAALSGMRPLWSRMVFQTQLAALGRQPARLPQLQARYQQLLDAAAAACRAAPGPRPGMVRLAATVARQPATPAYALCNEREA